MKRILSITLTILSAISCTQKVQERNFDYHVCAFVWPSCHDDSLGRVNWDQGIGEWEIIQRATPRYEGHYQPKQPLWGYEMDNDPVVVEKWIQTALKYGVNTFIYDWYWFEHYPYLESALNDGFLKAPSNKQMEFFIMWANHNVKKNYWNPYKGGNDESILWSGVIDPQDWPVIVQRVINQYFLLDNYTKIDGCPVFGLFSAENFLLSFGSDEASLAAIEYLRAQTKAAGFPDVHLMVFNGTAPKTDEMGAQQIGWNNVLKPDSWAWYNMGGFNSDYLTHCKQALLCREKWEKKVDYPLFPCVSIAWDDSPRFPDKPLEKMTRFNNTPEVFKHQLEQARKYADSKAETQPKFIMINAWNEWIEGSYLLPDIKNGYAYLEAVKQVMKDSE